MNPDNRFDSRLLDRNLAKGRLTQAEVDHWLKSLPDAAGNAANLEAAMADRGDAPAPARAEAPKKGGKHG